MTDTIAPDEKITDLDALTSPSADAILPIVNNPNDVMLAQTMGITIDELLAGEVAARDAAIAVEAGERSAADADLQSQIDATVLSGSGTTTTLDGSAASGQRVIPLTSTTGLSIGQTAIVRTADGTASEGVTIASISAGVSVTATDNLSNSYASGDLFSVSPVEVALARGDGYALLGNRLDAAIGSRSAALRALKKIYRNASDVIFCFIGDSTTAGFTAVSWVDYAAADLAARFATHSVVTMDRDDSANAYDTPVTVSVGTGPNTIYLLNGAVAATAINHALGYIDEILFGLDTLPVGVDAHQPDLVVISHGHNEPNTTTTATLWDARARMNLLVNLVKKEAPQAGIAQFLQNAVLTTADRVATQHTLHDAYMMAAQDNGVDTIDVHQAFTDTGDVASLLDASLLHPNDTGKRLIAALFGRYLAYPRDGSTAPIAPSSLLNPTVNLLPNGSFAQFVSPPTLTGWTATHGTLSKDTTHFESANGYSVRFLGDGSGAPSLTAILPAAVSHEFRGQWLCVLQKARVVSGSDAGAPGIISIICLNASGGAITTQQCKSAIWRRDAFVYNVAVGYVDPTTDRVEIALLPDPGAVASVIDISYDRVTLVPGVLPRDIPHTSLYANLLAAGQYPFPATQIASPDPNTFDDYYEKDFTPTLKFGGGSTGMTFSQAIGRATKIGREIVATVEFTLSAKGSSTGAAVIGGLPNGNNATIRGSGEVSFYAGLSGLTGAPVVSMVTGGNGGTLYQTAVATMTALTDANFTNLTHMVVTFKYSV